jgi:hypothetical protein
MGIFRKAIIAENRVYDDPKNPATSPFDVSLPITVLGAVFDPDTGDTVGQMILAVASALAGHTVNNDIHTSVAATQAISAAINDLGIHINNGGIHVTAELKAAWNAAAAQAAEAAEKAQTALNLATSNAGEISSLKDAVFNALTANPFTISFDNLNGLNIVSGIWNQTYQRIEC